jgi:CHAD domain-containing protein
VRVLRRRLLERRTRLRAGLPADGAPVRLAPSLEAAARRAARWRISGPEEDVALGGLHTAYERGRAAMVEAYHSGAHGHRFHDWRKRAKDLRYQLELLRGLWPQVQAAVASEMHRLTDFLGTANDFQVMATTLRREPDLVRGLRDPLALERRARFHRDRLAAEARPLGERLYAEAPETFRERHQALWSAWRR